MADTFTRRNLNPSAEPWGRQVEKAITDLRAALSKVEQRSSSSARTLAQKSAGANGDIYRDNGILVPADGPGDFSIYSGTTDDGTGAFSSLNVQPSIAQMRQASAGGIAAARLQPHSFDVIWGDQPNGFYTTANGELPGAQHWAIRWAWEDIASSSYYDNGQVANRRFYGSLFDGAIEVQGFQTFNDSGVPTSALTITAMTIKGFVVDMTTLALATTDAAGVVELATDDEAVAGTDGARAVTPSGLHAALTAAGAGSGGSNLADAWRGEWATP